MTHLCVSAYVPFMLPVYSQALADESVRIVDELGDVGSSWTMPLLTYYGATASATVDVYDHRARVRTRGLEESHKRIIRRLGRMPRDWLLARIGCDIELDVTAPVVLQGPDGETQLSDQEAREYYRSVVSELFACDIAHLVVAANIAAPCSLEAREGLIVMQDEVIGETASLVSNLSGAVEFGHKARWSPIRQVPLKSVLTWVKRNQLLTRHGDTAVSRAYNAFTHLFGPPGVDRESLEMFFALMGVEALFSEGVGGVMEQVSRRSQLLLGKRDGFKKRFSDMYNVRSAFVHGGMPFPSNFPFNDALPEVDRFHSKIYDASAVGAYLLLSALQSLVVNGWNTLEYELTLTGQDLPVPATSETDN